MQGRGDPRGTFGGASRAVRIGVDASEPRTNAEINFAISSRADYRIVTSHYPEKHELYKTIVEGAQNGAEGKRRRRKLKEQLVSLVIDNVTDTH